MTDPLLPPPGDDYQRPQQNWQCGLADEGPPCPMGPDGGGHCPAAAACRPVRDGDRWRCNRSAQRGGPCVDGPGPDGECAIVYRCTPVRSLRSRRGRIVGAAAVAAIGAACMMLSGPWRSEWIAPGPLSRVHAQLIAASGEHVGCAACHAAGDSTLAEWWKHSTGGASFDSSQSALCLKCHDQDVAATATSIAHDWPAWPPGATDDPTGRRRDPHESMACAACHHEHQGLDHDLTAMSDTACQACHQKVFHSFATDHPDFGDWPYERPTGIAFNHATHEQKHFVEAKQEFACSACHRVDSTGGAELTRSYAEACASCHDKALTVSLAGGVALATLPTLDVETLADAGFDARPWPQQAIGDFEGVLPAPMQLLLLADGETAAALAALGPRFDFFDLDVSDREQVESATRVVAGIRQLVNDLGDRGPAAIGERLGAMLGRPVSATELTALAAGLSPDMLGDYRDSAFAGSSASPGPTQAGGWTRDEVTLSLRYRASGHDDPWMRAWLDAYAEAATGPQGKIVEPLLNAALKPTAPGQCGSCHKLRKEPAGRLAIQWRAADSANARDGLTHFAHGPHLTDLKLRDCKACHSVAAATASTVAAHDFSPLQKAMCAQCHIDTAAGASCTQCHAYHSRDGVAAVANELRD